MAGRSSDDRRRAYVVGLLLAAAQLSKRLLSAGDLVRERLDLRIGVRARRPQLLEPLRRRPLLAGDRAPALLGRGERLLQLSYPRSLSLDLRGASLRCVIR